MIITEIQRPSVMIVPVKNALALEQAATRETVSPILMVGISAAHATLSLLAIEQQGRLFKLDTTTTGQISARPTKVHGKRYVLSGELSLGSDAQKKQYIKNFYVKLDRGGETVGSAMVLYERTSQTDITPHVLFRSGSGKQERSHGPQETFGNLLIDVCEFTRERYNMGIM